MTGTDTKRLGRLERVDLREVWASEAQGFTPWLAEEENLAVLAETVGLELELEAQEQNVGPFRADILCKDTVDNHWVLVENQLEKTDHSHLGQLMTYAAGLDAVTIIWIAERFTEEHRAALDWLNRVTEEEITFFGLEIELWQIGDSPVAPKFNIACKPNDWTKTVQTAAGQGELTDIKRMQLEYWTKFFEFLEANHSPVRCQKAQPQHWTNFAIGRSYFHLVAKVNTRDKDVAVYLCISGPQRVAHYHLLHEHYRQKVDAAFKVPLEWRELPEAKESQILARVDMDPTDRSNWGEQQIWLRETVETFHRVFAPIVKELDASDYEPDAPTE